jgi:hypothetical protein
MGSRQLGKEKPRKSPETNHNNMTQAQKSKRNGRRVKGQKKNLNGCSIQGEEKKPPKTF